MHFAYAKNSPVLDDQAIHYSIAVSDNIASFVNSRGGVVVMARSLGCTNNGSSYESKAKESGYFAHSAFVVSTKLLSFKTKVA
ncbi:MAG: hypothetical protein WCL07_04530 [bacterium]